MRRRLLLITAILFITTSPAFAQKIMTINFARNRFARERHALLQRDDPIRLWPRAERH